MRVRVVRFRAIAVDSSVALGADPCFLRLCHDLLWLVVPGYSSAHMKPHCHLVPFVQ